MHTDGTLGPKRKKKYAQFMVSSSMKLQKFGK